MLKNGRNSRAFHDLEEIPPHIKKYPYLNGFYRATGFFQTKTIILRELKMVSVVSWLVTPRTWLPKKNWICLVKLLHQSQGPNFNSKCYRYCRKLRLLILVRIWHRNKKLRFSLCILNTRPYNVSRRRELHLIKIPVGIWLPACQKACSGSTYQRYPATELRNKG